MKLSHQAQPLTLRSEGIRPSFFLQRTIKIVLGPSRSFYKEYMVSVIYIIYIKIQGPYVDFAVKKIQHRSLSERKCINQLYEELQTPYCFFVSYTLFPSLHGDDLTLARNQGHVSGRYLHEQSNTVHFISLPLLSLSHHHTPVHVKITDSKRPDIGLVKSGLL